ncbi:MAG: hypothetical protein ACE5IL_08395 [Myxococcota bacterium]
MPDVSRKLKMTFRVDRDLALALRGVSNQTAFVESALREALGRTCPLCRGSGKTDEVRLRISDLKSLAGQGRIDRGTASQLRALIRLGRALLATRLELEPSKSEERGLGFRLARQDELLLAGRLGLREQPLDLTH